MYNSISYTSDKRKSNTAIRNLTMAVLAAYPLLGWYATPLSLSLGMMMAFGMSLVSLMSSGINRKIFPSIFYIVIAYVFFTWSFRNGLAVWTFLPPGGTLFFIFLLSLAGGILSFDLSSLRRYMGWIVGISIPLFWFQFVALHTTGEHFCFVPEITGKFTYQGMTYAEMVHTHLTSNSPCSIFLEKSYMAYYLVAYLALRLFASDTREELLTPPNLTIIFTLLILRSGSGIVGLMALLAAKVLTMYFSGNSRKRFYVIILLIPILTGLTYLYSNSEIGSSISERTSEFNTEGTSGYVRITAGYVVYGSMPVSGQLFGQSQSEVANYSDMSQISDERFYVNGVQMILMTLGAVGLILWVLFYTSLFRKGNMLARMSIVILLLFSLLEYDYLNPYHLLLTVIPCAIVYRQSLATRKQ